MLTKRDTKTTRRSYAHNENRLFGSLADAWIQKKTTTYVKKIQTFEGKKNLGYLDMLLVVGSVLNRQLFLLRMLPVAIRRDVHKCVVQMYRWPFAKYAGFQGFSWLFHSLSSRTSATATNFPPAKKFTPSSSSFLAPSFSHGASF